MPISEANWMRRVMESIHLDNSMENLYLQVCFKAFLRDSPSGREQRDTKANLAVWDEIEIIADQVLVEP